MVAAKGKNLLVSIDMRDWVYRLVSRKIGSLRMISRDFSLILSTHKMFLDTTSRKILFVAYQWLESLLNFAKFSNFSSLNSANSKLSNSSDIPFLAIAREKVP